MPNRRPGCATSIQFRAEPMPGWRLGGDDDKRTFAWQPKTVGRFPRSPGVEGSPLQQGVHLLWTPRRLIEQLPLVLDEFGEVADAGLGV